MKKGIHKNNMLSGFFISTPIGLIILFLFGIVLIFIGQSSYLKETHSLLKQMVQFFGETFIGAAVLSIIMEIHTIQNVSEQIRDNLLLREPSFIEHYSDEELNKFIQIAIKQKIKLKSNKNINDNLLEKLISEHDFPLMSYIEQTATHIGNLGFYCVYHKRQINISPMLNGQYNINVILEVELQNITEEDIEYNKVHKFFFISQEQIKSFNIKEFTNSTNLVTEIPKVKTKCANQKPSTSQHAFEYYVEFDIPIKIEKKGRIHYILQYEYSNYEQSCYITYALPFVTQAYQETYSLIGEKACDYQLHASAYAPYKKQIERNNLVKRLNEVTLSIDSNKWILPGGGFVAVVRKKQK